jgi:hypothetical protein
MRPAPRGVPTSGETVRDAIAALNFVRRTGQHALAFEGERGPGGWVALGNVAERYALRATPPERAALVVRPALSGEAADRAAPRRAAVGANVLGAAGDAGDAVRVLGAGVALVGNVAPSGARLSVVGSEGEASAPRAVAVAGNVAGGVGLAGRLVTGAGNVGTGGSGAFGLGGSVGAGFAANVSEGTSPLGGEARGVGAVAGGADTLPVEMREYRVGSESPVFVTTSYGDGIPNWNPFVPPNSVVMQEITVPGVRTNEFWTLDVVKQGAALDPTRWVLVAGVTADDEVTVTLFNRRTGGGDVQPGETNLRVVAQRTATP